MMELEVGPVSKCMCPVGPVSVCASACGVRAATHKKKKKSGLVGLLNPGHACTRALNRFVVVGPTLTLLI